MLCFISHFLVTDDDKSMATELMEALPKLPTPAKKPAAVPEKQQHQQQAKPEKLEKPVKPKAKGGRVKGRVSTPERKHVRKEPVYIPREEIKKKKGSRPLCLYIVLYHFVRYTQIFGDLVKMLYNIDQIH